MQKREYKIGDLVMVKKDLVGGTIYPFPGAPDAHTYFNPDMKKFRGHEYKITGIVESWYFGYFNYTLSLGKGEHKWVFNSTMLEPVSSLRKLVCKRKN